MPPSPAFATEGCLLACGVTAKQQPHHERTRQRVHVERQPVGRADWALEAFKETGDGLEMLLGQQLCGGHHRGLVAVGRRIQHRAQGNHGLSAAHVPLEKPVRGLGLGDVVQHLAEHTSLGPRQLERQCVDVGAEDVHVHWQAHRRGFLPVVLAGQQEELPNDHLVEGEPPPRLRLGLDGLGPVVRFRAGESAINCCRCRTTSGIGSESRGSQASSALPMMRRRVRWFRPLVAG